MATHELILTVLVLYSSTTSLVLAQTDPTYTRRLPSGRTVKCNLCPPGFRLQKHCTETQPTRCQPCSVGFYSEHWNYMHDCLPCNVCSLDMLVAQECTSTTKLVCECKEGFYSDMGFCQPHKVCQDGYGVKEKGTKEKDTVCEPCSKGNYSSGQPGHKQCVPHTQCTSEERLLFHGTNYLDNVCVTCNNIKNNGWVKSIAPSFIGILKHHNDKGNKRPLRAIRRSENGKDIDGNSSAWFLQWFNEATEEQIKTLPEKLRTRKLANKIKHRIQKIVDEVNMCENTVHDPLN